MHTSTVAEKQVRWGTQSNGFEPTGRHSSPSHAAQDLRSRSHIDVIKQIGERMGLIVEFG